MPKLRVMILGPELHAISGVSTHLRELMGSPLVEDVDFLHFRVGSEGRSEAGLVRYLSLIMSPFALLLEILRSKPHIVHLNTSFDLKAYWRDVVYLCIARLACRRVVYQVHGGARPASFFGSWPLLRGLLRRVMRAADVVVVLSAAEAEDFGRFAPGLKLRAIANAVDVAAFADPERQVNRDAPLRLLYLGRLSREKGLQEMVEALGRLVAGDIPFEFHVAGLGPDEAAMRDWVKVAGLHGRVIWHGPVRGSAKIRFWRSGDVFVFPTYSEGMPYAILESMSSGTVPVASRVGAISEIVTDGVHGLLIPPRDADALTASLLRLHHDRSLLASMQSAGRERMIRSFSAARLAKDFKELYKSI